ncbi:NAD-dependent epimerase/dehydratase family protein [Fictibacillus iocasae]|uniref:NAD-dependent epimerase/dehydratase family protein n=1 Tax=Fictibacillus iocasae TaxID=2715437 RepID=A0ABW2NUT8_9BACL
MVVTGAAGFIGFHLCSRLLDEEVEVVGVDRNDAYDRIDRIGRHANFSFINENIAECAFDKAVKGCDTLFHLACQVKPSDPWREMEKTAESHLQTLKKVLEAIKGRKVKLIYASSYDVYGKRQGEVHENSPRNPENLFGLIKLTEENMIMELSKKYKIPYIILRLPTVYGPGQHEESTYHMAIEARLRGKPPVLIKDSVTEDALYIDDAVESLWLAANSNKQKEIYNIYSGQRDAWKKGLQLLKIKSTALPKEKRNMIIKGDKAQEELGFKASVPLREGLKKQMNHILSNLKKKDKR